MQAKKDDININFGALTIYHLRSSCGVFMGTNNATSWSAHTKSNSGLGSVSDGIVSNNINIVFDNDVIDSPIDDRDIVISNTTCSDKKSGGLTAINFDSIDAITVTSNSSISIGENRQDGWDSHSKMNFGNGSFVGSTLAEGNVSLLVDNDLIDSPINDQDFKPSVIQKKY
jgi:hypothetical protein